MMSHDSTNTMGSVHTRSVELAEEVVHGWGGVCDESEIAILVQHRHACAAHVVCRCAGCVWQRALHLTIYHSHNWNLMPSSAFALAVAHSINNDDDDDGSGADPWRPRYHFIPRPFGSVHNTCSSVPLADASYRLDE